MINIKLSVRYEDEDVKTLIRQWLERHTNNPILNNNKLVRMTYVNRTW